MYFYKEVIVCLSHCTVENMIKFGGAVDEIQPHDLKLSSKYYWQPDPAFLSHSAFYLFFKIRNYQQLQYNNACQYLIMV